MKTFSEIVNGMANWITSNTSKLTNFHVGSVLRTLLESIAVEIEGLYFQMRKGFNDASENAIFNSFDFHRFPALRATGTLTIKFKYALTDPITIAKGSKFFTIPLNGKQVYFQTTRDYVFGIGSTMSDIEVECIDSGVIGNVPSYSLRYSVIQLSQVSDIFNAQAFYTGKPEESKEERKKRFNRYIDTLARGTVSAIQYAALKVPGVAGAYVEDQIGYVNVYVHDAAGNLPEDLKQQVIRSILEYRAAGIDVIVLPVIKRTIDLDVSVSVRPGFSLEEYRSAVQQAVTSYLNYFTVSRDVVQADLTRFIMDVDINAIANCHMNLDQDIPINTFELVRAGTISVTVDNYRDVGV